MDIKPAGRYEREANEALDNGDIALAIELLHQGANVSLGLGRAQRMRDKAASLRKPMLVKG